MDTNQELLHGVVKPDKMIEWGVAVQLHEGEKLSGDEYVVHPTPNAILVAAIDGIGHGPQAASASRAAAASIQANVQQPLEILFETCHKALYNTRGVVMSLAVFDRRDSSMSWLGVGNVEGRLVRADKSSSHLEDELLLRNGVIGHDLPPNIAASILPVAKGDVLIFATDRIDPAFTQGLHIGRPAHQIANDILAGHNKAIDDALVIVAKYMGGEP